MLLGCLARGSAGRGPASSGDMGAPCPFPGSHPTHLCTWMVSAVLHDKLVNVRKGFTGSCEPFWQIIRLKLWGPQFTEQSDGDFENLGPYNLWLASEVGVSLVGLSQETVGSALTPATIRMERTCRTCSQCQSTGWCRGKNADTWGQSSECGSCLRAKENTGC